MRLEGVIGSSFESDMAIDDLDIYEVQTLDSNTCAFAPSSAKPAPPSARPPNTPSAIPPHTASPTVGYCK